MINVSMSGCGIESATRLAQGNHVVLLLHLLDQATPMQVDVAVVRWAREQRCGVEFLLIWPEQQNLLCVFLETLAAGGTG